MEDTPYVNIGKVADYFQVSVSTKKVGNHKSIPEDTYIKVGEVYRFRLDDVEAALTHNTKKGKIKPTENEKHRCRIWRYLKRAIPSSAKIF